ncbi:MFS transporter [Methylorubrum sp. Q1]|uniref:MFS transporter n=1 Tax=Methylorubrum sp. Q1 TaxID=2562453 RepID=UPI0010765D7A|nr:MFS transporter [Methylorubrum sp. Q1]TFZ54564.1 MFS transporter [Methylorubrum sp. Q1]
MSHAHLPTAARAFIPKAERTRVNVSLILLTLALGAFAFGTAEFAAMSLLPEIAADFSLGEPAAARVVSAYAIGVVVGAPLIAFPLARVSRRRLLIGCMALFAFGNGLSMMAPSFSTLLVFRFASGIPHGAYLGIAALTAASLVERDKRASAVATVILGLTLAMIVGVFAVTALGQAYGWRWAFASPGLLAVVVTGLCIWQLPQDMPDRRAGALTELKGLWNRQIWLVLLTGAIGFAGFFAVYAYTASILVAVTGLEKRWVPIMIALYGFGMTGGTFVAGRLADRALLRTPVIFLSAGALALVGFALAAENAWTVGLAMLAVSFFSATSGVLQTRLMDVAGNAQTAAAVFNHSAFNVANAIGPWLGGIPIALGYGFSSVGFVGAALSLGGLAIWLLACAESHRTRTPASARR